ncbi:MAG: hypothetical protein A2Y24_08295 [Clostridiales bacterium GWE2_32_10]|nr:MAG: hypothetical protein A2Y24_08295 [Clostridiales bacterium GWE2_32_10]HBY21630.1 hypothetical protein [Clostridiales bacterium]
MKNIKILLVICLLLFILQSNISSAQESRVIYTIVEDSKSFIDVTLNFMDTITTDKIQVTSYKKYNDNTIQITYRVSKDGELLNKISINKVELKLKLGNEVLPNIVLKDETSHDISFFADVSEQTPYHNSILNLYNRGVLTGYSDNTFKPDQPITREEFCQLFVKATKLNLSNIELNIFTDVANDRWSKNVINALAVKGILKGKESGKFNPTDNIIFGEVAAILDRTYSFVNIKNRIDYKHMKIEHWANEYVLNLLNADIINEEDDFYKNYTLNKNLTRAECVNIINRVVNGYKIDK